MKNLFKSFALAMLASATFSSCEQDPCKDVVCGDQGQCVEGTCVCNAGYEQDAAGLCNTEQRAKFFSSYAGSDMFNGNTYTYTPSIATSSVSITNVLVSNFRPDFFNNSVLTATVSGSTITVAAQEPDGDGYSIEGSGTLSGNTITWDYSITGADNTGTVVTNVHTGTWTKS